MPGRALGPFFLPSPSLSQAPGKLPAPPRASSHRAAKPPNGPPGQHGDGRGSAAWETGPRSTRIRDDEEEPPGPASRGPRRPRASAAPAPSRPSAPDPWLQPRHPTPACPRSPEGLAQAVARRLEPHGPPPAPSQTRVSPAVVGRALARAGCQRACALPPPRRARWARGKTRNWITVWEPHGGELQNPKRIHTRDFTGRWIVPKKTHNSEAETSSLCVFCRKSVRAKNKIVETGPGGGGVRP